MEQLVRVGGGRHARTLFRRPAAQAAALLALGVTEAGLEEVAVWLGGEDDVLDDQHRPFAGRVAAAYDILSADDELAEDWYQAGARGG